VRNKDKCQLWENAWDEFSVEAFGQIPTPKCFRLDDPSSPYHREQYKKRYKLEAIRRLLPKYIEKREFVTGRAKVVVEDIINLLEYWKTEMPVGTRFTLPVSDKNIKLVLPKPPERIVLPRPPQFRKRRLLLPEPPSDKKRNKKYNKRQTWIGNDSHDTKNRWKVFDNIPQVLPSHGCLRRDWYPHEVLSH